MFEHQRKPHISCVISRSPKGAETFSPCVCGYGELVPVEDGFAIKNWTQPRYGRNAFDGQTKNLVFFSHGNRLYCIWQCSPEHIVLELDGQRVVREFRTPSPKCGYGEMRGGTQPLPCKDRWLRFVHCNEKNPKSQQLSTYHVTALLMEPKPPFRIIHVREYPLVTGNEQYFPGNKFWKPKVAIPYGAVRCEGGWNVAYGHNDSQCKMMRVPDYDCETTD